MDSFEGLETSHGLVDINRTPEEKYLFVNCDSTGTKYELAVSLGQIPPRVSARILDPDNRTRRSPLESFDFSPFDEAMDRLGRNNVPDYVNALDAAKYFSKMIANS